jgi:hypothetical protein
MISTRILFTLLLLLAFSFTSVAFDSPPDLVARANEVIPQVIASGALRVDKPGCKAWISPMLWLQMDARTKENTAAAIAIYCSAHDPVIEIYDAQSAKRIARWGWAKGFEVF